MDACTNPDILRVIYFFLIIIDIVKIIIPIALIVMGIIDFSKAVVVSDEKVQKKSVSLFVKRLLYAALVFLVPWIVEVLMVTLGNLLSDEINFTDCLENANAECINELESGFKKGACDYGQNELACYVCNSDDKMLKWTSNAPTYDSYNYACPSGWRKTELEEKDCGEKKCWQCNSQPNMYHWGINYPSSSDCPSGWHQLNYNEEKCK